MRISSFLVAVLCAVFVSCQSTKVRPGIEDLETPEHKAKVAEVKRLLMTAEGYYNLGDYDSAHHTFNRVLTIDPYNQGAQNGIAMTKRAKELSMQPSRREYRGY
jgi:Tfp pilus assembly protein PilF